MLTHYCAWDATGRLFVRAYCGVLIRRTEHASEPTCDECARLARLDADALDDLLTEPIDAAQVATHVTFDPCADYKPRVKR